MPFSSSEYASARRTWMSLNGPSSTSNEKPRQPPPRDRVALGGARAHVAEQIGHLRARLLVPVDVHRERDVLRRQARAVRESDAGLDRVPVRRRVDGLPLRDDGALARLGLAER